MLWVGLAVVLAAYYGLIVWVRQHSCPLAVRWALAMRVHYLLFGLVLGLLLPGQWAHTLQPVLHSLIFFVATWCGFALGTMLDARVLRSLSPRLLVPVVLRTCLVFLLVYCAFWVLSPVVCAQAYPPSSRVPVALACGAVACVGMPWTGIPAVRTIKSVSSASKLLRSMSLVSAGPGLLAASAAIYAATSQGSIPDNILRSPGWFGRLGLSCVVGGIMGMVGDILVRDERDTRRTALLLFATLAVATGVAVGTHLLAPLVGMIMGLWLINATLCRMEITEFRERSADLFDGLLLALIGTAMGAVFEGTLGLALAVIACALVLFVSRIVGDALGCNLGARMVGLAVDSPRWLFGLGLLPQGGLTLAVAFVIKDVLPDRWFAIVVLSVLLTQWTSPHLLLWSLRSAERGTTKR